MQRCNCYVVVHERAGVIGIRGLNFFFFTVHDITVRSIFNFYAFIPVVKERKALPGDLYSFTGIDRACGKVDVVINLIGVGGRRSSGHDQVYDVERFARVVDEKVFSAGA